MPAVLVFLMVVMLLAFALGAVLLVTRAIRAEGERVLAGRSAGAGTSASKVDR